jgi:hypothetical protein
LKLIADSPAFTADQHDFGDLLVKVFFAMHHAHTKQVTIEAHRCPEIGDCDTDMIETEQAGQHTPEIGRHSGHAH